MESCSLFKINNMLWPIPIYPLRVVNLEIIEKRILSFR